MATFEAWFAKLIGQRELEVHRLLNDGRAIRFLITWAMFESRCFGESANEADILKLARRLTREGFDVRLIAEARAHFHARYQDKSRLRHLLHNRKSAELTRVLALPADDLSASDQVFLVLFVVFRFRNNMFHGNKGVATWLQYDQQIRLCTEAMQAAISHVEAKQKAAA